MKSEPTVFVVDDDAQVRESLRWLLESVDLAVETFSSAVEFLDAFDPDRPGCLILDLRMPGMSGLEVQQLFSEQSVRLPIIIISAYGDVPAAVQAMRAGAVDFIEKPFSDHLLLLRTREAIERDAQYRARWKQRSEIERRIATLTQRERQVMDLMVTGKPTKQIARQLGVSPKTVEVHRAHVMEKMAVESVAELVRHAVEMVGE